MISSGHFFLRFQYEYTQPPYSSHIHNLVRIVLNSLEAQFHRCKRIPATVVMDLPPPSRPRGKFAFFSFQTVCSNDFDFSDMSQPSLGGIGDRDEECTPPISPIFVSEGTSGAATSTGKPKQGLFTQKSAPTFSRKYQDSSLDADDTESELVAIPESDLSESTIHNSSAPGSFDDPHSGTQFVTVSGEVVAHFSRDAAKIGDELHLEEIVQPLRSEQMKGKVTTANLATAQVALSTLGVAERERTEEVRMQNSTKLLSLDSHLLPKFPRRKPKRRGRLDCS